MKLKLTKARDVMVESSIGNREYWQKLQDEDGYFDNHPIYQGLRDFSLNDYGGRDALEAIELFTKLSPQSRVVVIGCGYGRDTLQIAPHVHHVWGIDVTEKLLSRTVGFLAEKNIRNFTPVLASNYPNEVPQNIDLVFSVVVMQHLSRSLVRDYFRTLKEKLAKNGAFVVQFLEERYDHATQQDAEMRVYEPSISWNIMQLADLAHESGLLFGEIRTQQLAEKTFWHWVYFKNADDQLNHPL